MFMKTKKFPFMSFLKTSVFATVLFTFAACSNETPGGGQRRAGTGRESPF